MMLGYSASWTRASQHEEAANQDTMIVSWSLLMLQKLSQGDLQCLSSWWFNSFFHGKAAKPPCVELESEFTLESQQ